MKLTSRSAAAWLPLLIVTFGLTACGGGGSSAPAPSGGGGGGGGTPPPAPGVTAPSALSYTTAASYNVGTAITPLDPTVTGTVTSYAVSPALPAGIALDGTTGRITGTPTAPARSQSYTVTATNAGGNTTFGVTFAVLIERATTDRPDEKTGRQVHLMYVVPSDGIDEQLDQTGTLEGSARIWNAWLAAQTGGKELRIDTHGGGKVDVTYLKLARTDAQMNVAGGNVRAQLEFQLLLNGFNSVDKVYLVYYGGDGDGCGRGAWPPTLPGNVGAVYIGAAAGCTDTPFATGTEPPAFLEFMALHETMHVLGFAAACSPHHTETGHVSDGVTDLMYSGRQAGAQPWRPSTLDINLDDYYGLAVPGCLDLSNSAFLDPLPAGPEAPPGWPYANLTDLVCTNEPTTIPGPLGAATEVTFVNSYEFSGTPSTAAIYERVPDATQPSGYRRAFKVNVPYNDGRVVQTQENAVFVVLVNNSCRRLVRASANVSRFTITD